MFAVKVEMYTGNEPYIFISYSHKDTEKVMPIIERLDKDGYRLWYDEGIAPIETWDDFIAEKVMNCEIMLVFVSNDYVSSSNCVDELNFARSKNKKILRVQLEKNVDMPLGLQMRLDRIQAVFRTDYENEDDFFAKLYLARDISMCLKNENSYSKETTKIIYNDGIYEGETVDGVPNGFGIYSYSDGSKYEGDWKDGCKHGQGKMLYFNGDIYEGHWKNELRSGHGKIIYCDGEIYDGGWKIGQRSGYGKKWYSDGSIYEGEWKNGWRNGKGKIIFANKDIYEGEWKDDKRNGFGKMSYSDGDVYIGDWKDNEAEGRGKVTYKSGETYEGEWKSGLKNGRGRLTLPDGKIYEGEWDHGYIRQIKLCQR